MLQTGHLREHLTSKLNMFNVFLLEIAERSVVCFFRPYPKNNFKLILRKNLIMFYSTDELQFRIYIE